MWNTLGATLSGRYLVVVNLSLMLVVGLGWCFWLNDKGCIKCLLFKWWQQWQYWTDSGDTDSGDMDDNTDSETLIARY